MPSVYVVFSATPYKTGRFIRRMLGTTFNHVSFCLDPSLESMYSFARKYVNAPFSGGFVKESFRRFCYRGEYADIKVCRVELTQLQFERLTLFVRMMNKSPEQYLYNLYSAGFVPLGRRIHIRDSYTCVEFVGDALAYAGVSGLTYGDEHTLEHLEQILSPYEQYCGSAQQYPAVWRWGEDRFRCRQRKAVVLRDTAGVIARLTVRGLLGWVHGL